MTSVEGAQVCGKLKMTKCHFLIAAVILRDFGKKVTKRQILYFESF